MTVRATGETTADDERVREVLRGAIIVAWRRHGFPSAEGDRSRGSARTCRRY